MELKGKVCLYNRREQRHRCGNGAGIRLSHIAICGLAADDLLAQNVKQEVEALGRNALTITADVSDPNETVHCVHETVSVSGFKLGS